MCSNFMCLLLLIWMYSQEAYGQIQTSLGWNGGCNTCPAASNTGYVYGGYPVYPQYTQQYNQYPYYSQNFQQLPYVYASNQQQAVGNQQIINSYPTNSVTSGTTATKNVYDTIKTEVIDIDPKYFRDLYANYYPQRVRTPTVSRTSVVRQQTPYVVKIDSQQHNNTNVPQVIKKHDVQHKTFTFKKTFVLNPNENKDSVINLNFVNGVPVTTEVAEEFREDTTIKAEIIQEIPVTTDQPEKTEDKKPVSVDSWFI